MNTEQILRQHAAKYPLMQPTDAVKLLYQSTFGGGHLITEPQKSYHYLISEAERTPANEALPLTEDIGNGLVRVNIAAVTSRRYDFERLNKVFVASAQQVKGTPEEFLERIETLRRLTAEGIFAFDTPALGAYLAEYAAAGYPMVSHSERYRESYTPAYRVVLRSLLEESMGGALPDSDDILAR